MNEKRKTVYYWKNRHDLITYFCVHFKMSIEHIEEEIEKAQAAFQLRKQKAIDVRDLWQKTGLTIINRSSKPAPYCTCKDICQHLVNTTCNWKSSCPWRTDIRTDIRRIVNVTRS